MREVQKHKDTMDLNLNPDLDPQQFPVLSGEKELTHDIGNCHHHR
jgi:hypothetical protein